MAPIGGSAGAFNSLVLQGTHPVRLTIGTTARKTAEQVIDYYRRAGNQPLNEGWERGHKHYLGSSFESVDVMGKIVERGSI